MSAILNGDELTKIESRRRSVPGAWLRIWHWPWKIWVPLVVILIAGYVLSFAPVIVVLSSVDVQSGGWGETLLMAIEIFYLPLIILASLVEPFGMFVQWEMEFIQLLLEYWNDISVNTNSA